jgi:predicted nucleotidyltransferase
MRSVRTRVTSYVDAIAGVADQHGIPLVGIIVFGSAVTGGFADHVSDVDLILVIADSAAPDTAFQLRQEVDRIESSHGFRVAGDSGSGVLEQWLRRITANVRSYFICTRSDLISGDPARLLGIPATQAFFVDRAVIPNIVNSAVTVWGEDLLPLVPMPPIRRLDVFKAFFGLANQLLLTAAAFPFVPSATQYAAGALKRSVHNCYFCYHLRTAALEDEIDFFRRDRKYAALDQLLDLRREPRRSLRFVLRCIPTAARLHLRTARENDFPKEVRSIPATD